MEKELQESESLNLEFLIGRKIVEIVDNLTIKLDNGEMYEVIESEGCGGCSSGWSEFSGFEELPLDNMITNVEYKDSYQTEDEDKDEVEHEYNIFVYFGDKRFDLEADDGWGNGRYGGGFTVTVKKG